MNDQEEGAQRQTHTGPVETHPLFIRRRSIRRFKPEPLTDEQVRVLLEAAMSAPSGHNLRPWHFVVVRQAETRRQLAETHRYSRMAAEAPVVLVVCTDESESLFCIEDACAAAENILLQAVALGLGAVWVAVSPYTDYEAYVRQLLGIPETMRVLCMIPVGYPAEEKPPRTRYDASKVHFERFAAGTDGADLQIGDSNT